MGLRPRTGCFVNISPNNYIDISIIINIQFHPGGEAPYKTAFIYPLLICVTNYAKRFLMNQYTDFNIQ